VKSWVATCKLGDRAYALVDSAGGKVASAKNPRKWPGLFDCRAAFADVPRTGAKAPPVRVTLPDGTVVNSGQRDLDQILSKGFKREVKLSALPDVQTAAAEEYWRDIEGLDHRDTVTDFGLPEGTFFDCALVHLLTTTTLDRLRELSSARAVRGSDGFVLTSWWRPRRARGISLRMPGSSKCSRSEIPFV
jgi:uncharacterized protein